MAAPLAGVAGRMCSLWSCISPRGLSDGMRRRLKDRVFWRSVFEYAVGRDEVLREAALYNIVRVWPYQSPHQGGLIHGRAKRISA